MLKVVGTIQIGNLYCVSVEGDTLILKNGLRLIDEKGNRYIIKTIGMPHYHIDKEIQKHAELVLDGDIKNIGLTLEVE